MECVLRKNKLFLGFIFLFLYLNHGLSSEVYYPWKDAYIGALDAEKWAGLVFIPQHDSAFAFHLRVKKGEETAEGIDLFYLISEVGPIPAGLGGANKQERLRYLRDYWAKKLEKLRGVRILTSYSPEQSCGIGTFTVDHIDIPKLSEVLFEKHKIYTISVGIPKDTVGIRMTPSVYTTLRELDIFIEAVDHYITNGLPS